MIDTSTTLEGRRIDVFEKAAPSVVYIDTFIEQRDTFSPSILEIPAGTGSGFVWDDKGHIVTNYHVLRSAKSAKVAILSKIYPSDNPPIPENKENKGKTNSANNRNGITYKGKPASLSSLGQISLPYTHTSMSTAQKQDLLPGSDPNVNDFARKVYTARVVGVDPGKDIAVLKIDAPVIDLFPIDVGTSRDLRVGQSAFAIGNPFGLDHTLTVGVVSGVGREVKSPIGRPISNVIQTDAAINPGNSGGPLLDSSGRLIGINTSIFSPSGASAGIGFAIPVDSVKYVVDTLIRDGKVTRPILGITLLENKQARTLGVNKGVLILDVPEGSPASQSGMRGTRRTEYGLIDIGDIIVRVDDANIETEGDLFGTLEKYKPGDTVRVEVNRPQLGKAKKELGGSSGGGKDSYNTSTLKLVPKFFNVQLKASPDIGAMMKMIMSTD